ncbi:MAG: hypothetical protein JST51_00370 [Armatimonadetes bacterium]|nr:hypothetical protein [Armatimonadota bacterium]
MEPTDETPIAQVKIRMTGVSTLVILWSLSVASLVLLIFGLVQRDRQDICVGAGFSAFCGIAAGLGSLKRIFASQLILYPGRLEWLWRGRHSSAPFSKIKTLVKAQLSGGGHDYTVYFVGGRYIFLFGNRENEAFFDAISRQSDIPITTRKGYG